MKRLIIIGASAMGREACAYAHDCGYEVRGYLDSRKEILTEYSGYPPIVGSVEEYVPSEDDVFVCAIGDPGKKKAYCEIVSARGGNFVSIVHPKAYVAANARIGTGCIVCPNSTITADVRIGSHVIVNVNSSVNHDSSLGDYTTVSPGCNIAGWCTIGSCVFMGVNSACIPHVRLGDDVFVAASALVISDVASGRVMGIPAKIK